MRDHTIDVFFALLQRGLWEDIKVKGKRLKGNDLSIDLFPSVDWQEVMRIAEEQSVEGLVTAGLEHIKDDKIPQDDLLEFIGQTLQIEQQNVEMNQFVGELVEKMRKADIYTLLVKGQGIAQCYERPLWRTSGDVDLWLSTDNFEQAKKLLLPLSSGNKPERNYSKELGFFIDSWSVELHGTQRTGLSTRIDKVIDDVQKDLFFGGNVRSWQNGRTTIFLPAPDNDVFIVFTHFIKHFYKEGGMTIRQLCDWCRLLWTYRDSLNHTLLESRIRKAGLMMEWKAFAALAIEWLGMPVDAMPLYCPENKWRKKADKIADFILKGGEWQRIQDTIRVGRIFPLSVLRFLPSLLLNVNWLKIKERVF